MKSYTDLEQSKKLAEILPIESVDMCYPYDRHLNKMYGDIPYVMGYKKFNKDTDIPCWSLSALLSSVKYNTINLHYNDVRNDWVVSCTVEHSTRYESGRALNPIDACYEMILKLKEQNLL